MIDRNNLPRSASEYVDFLKMLDQKIRWILDWIDCFKPILCAKSSEFIPLLRTQDIMAYASKIFLRQLERVQGLPSTPDITEFTVSFDKRIYPSEITMKIPIIEARETLSDDERIAYISELKKNVLVTLQYED